MEKDFFKQANDSAKILRYVRETQDYHSLRELTEDQALNN